jgi:hypothetical protein
MRHFFLDWELFRLRPGFNTRCGDPATKSPLRTARRGRPLVEVGGEESDGGGVSKTSMRQFAGYELPFLAFEAFALVPDCIGEKSNKLQAGRCFGVLRRLSRKAFYWRGFSSPLKLIPVSATLTPSNRDFRARGWLTAASINVSDVGYEVTDAGRAGRA